MERVIGSRYFLRQFCHFGLRLTYKKCRDLTPDTHWSLSLTAPGPIQTDTYCLTNSQAVLLLSPCDSSKNQIWTFQERDPVLENNYA